MLRKWEELPSFMQCEEVRKYYDILSKKKTSLRLKRIFDVVMAEILLAIFAIPMLIIAMMIKLDSPGPCHRKAEGLPDAPRRMCVGGLCGGSLAFLAAGQHFRSRV